MDNADATFTDTQKVILSLTSSRSLIYATTLRKITIRLVPDPIKPQSLRIYSGPKPTQEEGEVLPPKPVRPRTCAALTRTDLATNLVACATWAPSGLPS
jgi:hypothetical protein